MRRYVDRTRVTADVVDIDSKSQDVLYAADVTELDEGSYEVLQYFLTYVHLFLY